MYIFALIWNSHGSIILCSVLVVALCISCKKEKPVCWMALVLPGAQYRCFTNICLKWEVVLLFGKSDEVKGMSSLSCAVCSSSQGIVHYYRYVFQVMSSTQVKRYFYEYHALY
mmetsp:Transcript_58184/g.96353  ORF Transcript_58184/g.96353 Transcript_58184/m.96353 type:complete len:113 (+) Transcript_58184:227-565(+)